MATAPLRRVEFSTSDPAEARELIDQMYGGRLIVDGTRDSWRLTLNQVDAGEIVSAKLRAPADLSFKVDGRDEFVICTILGGALSFDQDQGTDRFQRGDVHLGTYPGADSVCHTFGAHVHTLALAQSLLSQVAGTEPGGPGPPVTFIGLRPVPGGARQWRETARFVDRLLAQPGTGDAPLLIGSAGRLLAATALAIFPNDAVTGAGAADSRDARPETLRRAVAFMEANAQRDIALADVAAAAHVTVRAVQLAFRRHLDTTPSAYLRRVRLERARAELQASTGPGVTVTDVAFRWGFSSSSRFARHYRSAYGEQPSSTLRG